MNHINDYAFFIAIPVFIVLKLLEIYIGWKDDKQNYLTKDTLVNISSGLIYFFISLITKSFKLLIFFLAYDNLRIFTIDYTIWWSWLILFFLDDLTFYWGHRIAHSVSFYWASHVVHHSSQYFNFSTALRKTWTYDATGHFLFWIWLPILGFHPLQVFSMITLNFIYQYWIHTEKVGKLPKPIELIFNTPSHHRVHHGSDLKYLDKNHGGVLIIWDRLFGTFQEEEESPNYGLTTNINSNNLFKVEFHEWQGLLKRIKNSKDMFTGIKYLVMPPGWSHDKSTLSTKELRQLEKSHSKN
ncbi:sterol desaturase family protein [Maribacter ulvicola]|uniref:Sterol desaturase/sphingolipid hydroxylase, fatty acid hydroxylase superfamily n=1 Tax=Maribacter ulvicola TaxID=228959 RepID=A0A1N6V5P9_9FLAO|nr:sterol desaturase family protein [Maribacter ulvicola]SIQ73204.1 Sterol desaturase/sphingolipid hydroxylase, fatty acid hydroxylase superfamily [Maribacter ulvicola]